MEVGNINTVPIPVRSSAPAENPLTDLSNKEIFTEKESFNYEKVMMGPDELKTFFYMLIGASDLRVVSDGAHTGSVVDQFA
jgi:hypothetical protein